MYIMPGAKDVIRSVPAGNNFPATANALGSMSLGNIIPESMVEGRNNKIENMAQKAHG